MKQGFAGNKNIYYDDSGKFSEDLYSFKATERFKANPESITEKNINDEAIFDFLSFGAVFPPNSPFEGIRSMFPGEVVEYSEQTKSFTNSNNEYQELVRTPIKYLWSVDKFASQLDKIFTDYFARQTKIHKNISVMLSGGVDSSVILSYLPKSAVTACWAGWGQNSTDLHYAKLAAKHFNMPEPLVSEATFQEDLELFKECIEKLKHPVPFGFIAFARMARDVSKHFKSEPAAILMGQNADTVAGSFKSIAYAHYLSKLNHLWPFLRPYFRQQALKKRKKYLLATTNPVAIKSFFHSNGINPGPWLKTPSWYFPKKYAQVQEQLGRKPLWFKHFILMDELMTGARRDQYAQNRLPELYGLQTLVPFYDKEVVRLFLSIPQRIRRRKKFGKVVLRELAKMRDVPVEIITKKKKGLAYGYKKIFAAKEHLLIWDEMEQNQMLNKYIDIKKIRERNQENFPTFEILLSLHFYLKLILNTS